MRVQITDITSRNTPNGLEYEVTMLRHPFTRLDQVYWPDPADLPEDFRQALWKWLKGSVNV